MESFSFLAVDLQNDFATEGGKHYKIRPSVDFLKTTLFPFLEKQNIKIGEIISDYRQPRGSRRGSCVPGTWGYESIVPREIVKAQWIKCQNSPLWTRENIGDKDKIPGLPYEDPRGLGEWLANNIGNPDEVTPIVFGLTVDCCVLSTLQELKWRGYHPKVLVEGVDHYSGIEQDKNVV
ncbi:MAG: hypothetical protein WCT45_03185, partial [Candidatus Paceibacterota bacterium]